MKAFILAGGRGERLKPLTDDIPKPLLQINDKPIIEHLFDLFRKYEINDVILGTAYKKEKFREYFADASKFGMRIDYVEEEEPQGTGHILKLAEGMLNETFVVSNGDELKDMNLKEMLSQHKLNNALVTIALKEVSDPSIYGVAKLQKEKIVDFIEKPEKGKEPSNFINAGLYIMEPAIFKYIPNGFSMLEKAVFPVIAKEGRLYGYKFKGQWFDTGTIERYEEAIRKWEGIK